MDKTIPQLFERIVTEHGDTPAQYSKDANGDFHPRTYTQLRAEVFPFAAGLHRLGVRHGDHVGLISENRQEWLVTDLACQYLGAADVPRGNDSMAGELAFILGFADCSIVVVENRDQLAKVASVKKEIKSLKTFIVLDPGFSPDNPDDKAAADGVKTYTYASVAEMGAEELKKTPDLVSEAAKAVVPEDIATIIFTSGTTGEPKGVMLTHANYLYEVSCIPEVVHINPGHIWLCVLPVWHSFERIIQYVAVASASALAYSKPIGKIMLGDMEKIRPHWMASVPRIWEAVRAGVYRNVKLQGGIKWGMFRFFVSVGGTHARLTQMLTGLTPDFKRRIRALDAIVAFIPWLLLTPLKALGNALVFGKIKAKLGGRFIAGISGGGALPAAVDTFFGAAGILLLEGYGLTETSPVVAVRLQDQPVPSTVGPMLRDTSCQIRDEAGNVLPPGTMGIIYVAGPQNMVGYYQRPEATRAVLDGDGWLNTGDLGMLTHRGELKITGRAKDTIVLLGGENIEPLPIEQKITESEYIDMAVAVGQDQKYLGALVVPNREAVERYADTNHIPYESYDDLLESEGILELIDGEIAGTVNAKNGFKGFERIFRFKALAAPFEVGQELSAKQEVKRHVVAEKYQRQIAELFR